MDNIKYSQDELDILIEQIPPSLGAGSFPNIFDLIGKVYQDSKTNDMLSNGEGGNNTYYAPISRTLTAGGRGSSDYIKSTPLSTDEVKEDDPDSMMALNKLKGMVRGG